MICTENLPGYATTGRNLFVNLENPIMKSKLFLAAAMVIVCGSCKKNDHHPQDLQSKLQGIWELRYQSVSWQPDSTFPVSNGSRLLTFAGAYWHSTAHGEAGGTYTVIENPTFPSGVCGGEYTEGYRWKINFINGTDTIGKYVHLSGDTLTLRQGCFAADGGRLEQYVSSKKYVN